MTATYADADLATRVLGPGAARMLGGPDDPSLAAHLLRYGPLAPERVGRLRAETELAGLRGRGGAGFPTHVKLAALSRAALAGRRSRPAVVVANATEGEPASAKDKVLLRRVPHLVIDGMVAAGAAVGATRGVLCIDRRDVAAVAAAARALAERRGRDPVAITIAETPSRYVAGEESALVAWLNGGPARPAFKLHRPAERGVGGAPTLLDNAETLADLGLIARFGGAAYRMVGDPEEPGTVLLTVRGGADRPGVHEVPTGTPLGAVIADTGRQAGRGALIGGYFGTWVPAAELLQAPLSAAGLAPLGASLGCGLVAVMPDEHCPLQEVSAVLHWLAANTAGQCGPCVNGLPALAAAFDLDAAGDRSGRAAADLDRWAPMVSGRGACKLPDGAVRFLDSARRTFAAHIEQHRRHGPCPPNREAILPTPPLGEWR